MVGRLFAQPSVAPRVGLYQLPTRSATQVRSDPRPNQLCVAVKPGLNRSCLTAGAELGRAINRPTERRSARGHVPAADALCDAG